MLIVPAFSGCFYVGQDNYDDVVKKPVSDWSTRDALTVMMSCASHNLYDVTSPNIKVIATPYFPNVILASNKVWEDRKHLTVEQYRATTEDVARYNAGLYIDWKTNQFVDSRGNYFRGPLQLDSLMFMVHMENYKLALCSSGGQYTHLWRMGIYAGYPIGWIPLLYTGHF